jgi:hypothetical protein
MLRREGEIDKDKKALLFEIDAMIEAGERGHFMQKGQDDRLEAAYLTFRPHFKARCLKRYKDTWERFQKMPPCGMPTMSIDGKSAWLSGIPKESIAVLKELRELVEKC